MKFVDLIYRHSTEQVTMDKILCHQTDTFVLVIHHQFDPCRKEDITVLPTVHYGFDLITMSSDFLGRGTFFIYIEMYRIWAEWDFVVSSGCFVSNLD